MPRDSDDNNRRPPGRRGPPSGGKGKPSRGGRPDRPSRARPEGKGERAGGDKKFAGKSFGKRPDGARGAGKGTGFRKDGDRPRSAPRRDDDRRSDSSERPFRKSFDGSAGRDRSGEKPWQKREDRPARAAEGDRGSRQFDRPKFDKPKFDRPREDRGDRPPRAEGGRFDKRPSGDRKPFEKRSYDKRASDEGRPERPRSDKPWQKRDDRPARGADGDRGPRKFDKPKFDRPKFDKPKFDRPRGDRDDRPRPPRAEGERFERRSSGDRPRSDKPWQKRDDRPARAADGDRGPRKFDRPREDRPRDRDDRPRAPRREWQDHPRNENSDAETRAPVARAPFGGRGEYRERKPDFKRGRDRDGDRKGYDKRPSFRDREVPEPEKPKKAGERIAKVVARAGMCSRRDAEHWIIDGRVAVNGRIINSPALDVMAKDVVTIDGERLPERERTRLFLYHKPRGLVTTHADPEGRPTVFDNLPEDLPRLISIGRLDFNTEGLLLLTNDGGLARTLELPDTGWLRRYRVRAHGEITQPQLDALRKGIEVDGVKYGSIEATLDREQGANAWITFAIREGKNREVRNVLGALGLEVNRLIRISYGPFQLGELPEGDVEEIKTRVLRDQLGEKIATTSGADFKLPARESGEEQESGRDESKRSHRAGLIKDRKGRRILVERAIPDDPKPPSEEERFKPYKRPVRPFRGKEPRRDK